jgi:hypothetical protein
VAGLTQILATEVGDGVTELACHPGCADHTLVSSHTTERELKLQTLATSPCAASSTAGGSPSPASEAWSDSSGPPG